MRSKLSAESPEIKIKNPMKISLNLGEIGAKPPARNNLPRYDEMFQFSIIYGEIFPSKRICTNFLKFFLNSVNN